MALRDHLKQIRDVFSVRNASKAGYNPDEISERLRNRILIIYTDVLSGRMKSFNPYSTYSEDRRYEFWDQMRQALRHLYGRPVLFQAEVEHAGEDAIMFVQHCNSSEFFDFIELS